MVRILLNLRFFYIHLLHFLVLQPFWSRILTSALTYKSYGRYLAHGSRPTTCSIHSSHRPNFLLTQLVVVVAADAAAAAAAAEAE